MLKTMEKGVMILTFQLEKLDHVQLAIPESGEEEARNFYGKVLGFQEVEKPETLKRRGGVWFKKEDLQLHCGVEEPFTPQKKAHPAIRIKNLAALIVHLRKKKIAFQQDTLLPGADRIYVFDPFGNRLEFLEWQNK
ncbi:VOC family protein [Virgibacillus halophilus]|uniref:VOC family protein n=1 Tax=Tigheibacillus halophilus TaxID=361280 RepID=A0ABU5CB69_9BACI|nr:VOC family protein [Virgibacillus halophilus]